MKLLGYGGGAATYTARWQGEPVVVKKCDVWKQESVAEELENEARIYTVLKDLQGIHIPKLKLEGIADGIDMVVVTEHIGRTIDHERLNDLDCQKIRKGLEEIHRRGVLHNDIHPDNILLNNEDGERRFFFIDFGLSKRSGDFSHEMEKLQNLLDGQCK